MSNYKSKKLHTYNGKLIYNPIAEYELVYPGGMVNISSLLSKVYYSPINNKIHIKIMNGSKTLFNEEGYLLMKKDMDDIYSFHVNGNNLELVLFENTDKYIDVEIFAEALDTERTQKHETRTEQFQPA